MLDVDEWKVVEPTLLEGLRMIQRYRGEHGVGIAAAQEAVGAKACQKYNELTGFHETNPSAIYHHRNDLLGPDCPRCGKPYRTAKARFCAACGHGIEDLESEEA